LYQGLITTGVEALDAVSGTLLTAKNVPSAEYVKPTYRLNEGFMKTTTQDALGRAMLNVAAADAAGLATTSAGQSIVTAFFAGGATGLRGLLMRVLRAEQPKASQQELEAQAAALTDIVVDAIGDELGQASTVPGAWPPELADELSSAPSASSASSESEARIPISTEFYPQNFQPHAQSDGRIAEAPQHPASSGAPVLKKPQTGPRRAPELTGRTTHVYPQPHIDQYNQVNNVNLQVQINQFGELLKALPQGNNFFPTHMVLTARGPAGEGIYDHVPFDDAGSQGHPEATNRAPLNRR
jgi:hypothetical protein